MLKKIILYSFYIGLLGFVFLILVIFHSNRQIEQYSQAYLFDDLEKIPQNKVGLILGTSKKIQSGQPNLYFKYRIKAAAELYHAGKIAYLLVSGDNSLKEYNEPLDMQKALIAQGVPDSVIVLDYAGFRTLDSVVRSEKVFGQKKITIISQEFHNKRALYIARKKGIEAIAYNAQDVGFTSGIKVQIREKMARVKVLLDLYLLNTQPKFLGDEIAIGKE